MKISLSDHFTYKRLFRFIFPTIVMMVITSVYSIVDGFFVSAVVGKNAFAAVNLIMPALIALSAFGFMIGTGGSALVSRTLGEKKKELANQYFSMLVYVVIGVGLLLSITGFIFMPQIAKLLGASELILNDCVIYGRVIMIALTFFMLQNTFQSFLITAERPRMGLVISIITGVNNIVFDFILVYVCGMGVLGAALATAMSQIIGGLVPLIYFARNNSSHLKLVKTKIKFRALGHACLNGSSEMVTNLSTSFVGMLYNLQLLRIAQEDGVAAYGVVMYVSFIFLALFFGYSLGCGPIVAYHYGAENTKELKNLFKKSMTITVVAAMIMTVLGILLSSPLSHLFVGYDAELMAMTVRGMALYSFSFLLCGFNIFTSAFFTALSNGPISALISFLRTLVFQVATILILPGLIGIDGVWISIVVAEAATIIVTILLLIGYRKKYQYV